MTKPVFIRKDDFPVIGYELRTTTQEGKNFREIPEFWDKIIQEKGIERIPNRKYPNVTLGICMDFREDGSFCYLIASEVSSEKDIPEGMTLKQVPAAEYAVFTARGEMPESIQETVKYIYREWLPHSNYMRTAGAEFELYDERCEREENPEVDIYVPVKPAE